ncbi:hypothetical protein PT974_06056 [Cladobotryum mycophilum]|uniref:Uncharacterized protein n=1 Tax=Cladobotryum mycophilum TaxID=491253 RepID=A0ABR0SLE9_9HYPO
MLRRAAVVSRHATLRSFATPHIPARHFPSSGRQISFSFLPWRRKAAPQNLPVYFPKPASPPKVGAVRRRLGRILFTTLAFYACWQIFATVVFDPLFDWADREWEALSEKEKKEMENMAEEDEPILFLPFPFTTKEVQQPFYKGSDPEWATFVAVNKDQQLQKDINRTCGTYSTGVERNPAYVQLLGGKDIKLKKMWLDIIYPAGPPPKHYVSGIIIDDDGIFWGDRPMDSLAASHLNMAIYPKAVALSVWTFLNSLANQTANDIAKALGFNPAPPPETTWQAAIMNRIKEQGELGATGKQAVKVPGQPERAPNFPIHTSISEMIGSPFGSDSQVDPRIQNALQAATLTFSKNWQPAKQPPNRGCIRVDGLVELQGKTAIIAVYVLGWYDPKQRKYMGVQTGLKHLIPMKQSPAGG